MAVIPLVADIITVEPLRLVEETLEAKAWQYDMLNEKEILATVPSSWDNFQLWVCWQQETESLHFQCNVDDYAGSRAPGLYELLGRVNDRLWLGLFACDESRRHISFRYTLPLRETPMPSDSAQIEDILMAAQRECEQLYPALQSLLHGGQSAEDAMKVAILHPVGEA